MNLTNSGVFVGRGNAGTLKIDLTDHTRSWPLSPSPERSAKPGCADGDLGGAGDPGFEVSLDATRHEPANDDEPEHGEMLRGAIRF